MLQRIQDAVRGGDVVYGFHSKLRQVEKGITEDEIGLAIGYNAPEIIEDYPDDPRGRSCLVRGETENGVIHVLCTVETPIFIITCYRPDPNEWYNGFRRRKTNEVP